MHMPRAIVIRPTGTSASLPAFRSIVEVLSVPFDSASMTAVHRGLVACMANHGDSDFTAYKLPLAISEVMSNAVRHGGGCGQLQIWRHLDRWLIQITDRGKGIPPRYRDALPRRASGRLERGGLWLVNEICQNITIDTGPAGTIVRMEYQL